ncbi:hypothetical protein [Cytobacillus praedii]|uniref:hypothetical protein n=2 Tax=Cytobacillus praedii TaxID=1742358 RepID=UPI0013F4AA2C|nr:hypothetical protein [Cytobacillus praedii]
MGEAFTAILPLLIYFSIIGFSLWFCISLIIAQRERNQILRDISSNLKDAAFLKKEEL